MKGTVSYTVTTDVAAAAEVNRFAPIARNSYT
jgi:hypothetical protein